MRGCLRSRCLCWLVLMSLAGITFGAEPELGTAGRPLKIVMLSGSEEYESAVTLPKWKEQLEKEYHIDCDLLQAEKELRIPELERMKGGDLLVIFTRRIKMPVGELGPLKEYVASKKPILGLRTASHSFQEYLEFDKEILGGNYQGHYGKGVPTTYSVVEAAQGHPVLTGIEGSWTSEYSLYKTAPIGEGCVPLLMGKSAAADQEHPGTWVREVEGRRVFYTALGGRTDFDVPQFQRLLMNAISWTTDVPLERLKRP